ncbi:MAG: hypothetical protein ABIK96_17095 [bacterium]
MMMKSPTTAALFPPLRRTAPLLAAAILVFAFAGTPDTALAQGSVRAWGMGGALTAASRGLEAVEFNPANLGFSEGSSLGLAGAAVTVGNNSLSLEHYNEITGSHLDAAAKDRLLGDIPQGGMTMDADVRVSTLGYQSGNLAFSIGALGQGRGNLDRDYFDLVLYGNRLDTSVDFSNTWGAGYAVATATGSWGFTLHEGDRSALAAGFNVRYLHGIYEIHVDEAFGRLDTMLDSIDGQAFVSTLSSEGGRGLGMDAGMAWRSGAWDFGLTVENLVSRIAWDTGIVQDTYLVTASRVMLLDGGLDTAFTDEHLSHPADGYATSLPRSVRAGAARRLGSWLAACDVGYRGSPAEGQDSTASIHAGGEWQGSRLLRPRLGLFADDQNGLGGSLGLGIALGSWRLDTAATAQGGFLPDKARGLGLAVGSSLVF